MQSPQSLLSQEKEEAGDQKNIERKVLNPLENLDHWYNTKEESKVSLHTDSSNQKTTSLLFATVVDHKIGTSPDYPIGWPRVGLYLKKSNMTDWSEYDFVRFWVYTESSRKKLPKNALSAGLYHGAGSAQSSTFPLDHLRLKEWVKIVIPISKITSPKNVQKIQFNIAEADYKHGDKIDFYISPIELLKYTQPVFDQVQFEQTVLYTKSKFLVSRYRLMGPPNLESVSIEVAIYDTYGKAHGLQREAAMQQGELRLRLPGKLKTGSYKVRLRLKSEDRKLLDEKTLPIRVIEGPF